MGSDEKVGSRWGTSDPSGTFGQHLALAHSIPKAHSPREVVINTVGGDPKKPWLRWITHGQSHDLTSDEISALRSDSPVLVTFLSRPHSLSPAMGTLNGRFALVDAANLRLPSGG